MVENENIQDESLNEVQSEPIQIDNAAQEPEVSDYYLLSLVELISAMEAFCTKDLVESHRKDIEKIRSTYYSKLKTETDAARTLYVQEHGNTEGFQFESHEGEFKEVYGRVKDLRAKIVEEREKEQAENLKKKQQVIAKLEALTNAPEKTFAEFRALQEEWKSIGSAAHADEKTIWEKYHLQVAKFYDYVKIERELRDLDQKKNYDAKIALCEKAEALAQSTQITKAFAELQLLHEEWRRIGPVKDELKEPIWERFKAATTVVNKAHQDYFVKLKQQEKENLEKKTALCERIEAEVSNITAHSVKQWNEATEKILNIQQEWKSVGFAPKKVNDAIYERFKGACNKFFEAKKAFYSEARKAENDNKALKNALCEKAEAMKTRTDWKDAAQEYVRLQKEWKTIGNVSPKDSQKLWLRFQAACNAFYEAKKAFDASQEQELQDNIALKDAIIAKILEIEIEDKGKALKNLSAIQEEWTKIAVPASAKQDLQKRFSEAVNDLLKKLQIEQDASADAVYKIKISAMLQESEQKVRQEETALKKKLSTLRSELQTLENNISFFGKSAGASQLVASVEKNIEKSKREIATIQQKLNTIKTVLSRK